MPTVTVKYIVGNSCNECPYKMKDGLSPYCFIFKERSIEESYTECLMRRHFYNQ